MKATLSCFVLLVLAAVGHGATNPGSTPPPLTAKEIAQGYREHVILARPHEARRATIDDEEVRDRVRVRARFERFGGLRVIDLDDTDNADAAVARLRATGRYDFVEPDYLRSLQVTPNDPKYTDGSQWHIKNNGQSNGVAGADMSALQAWDVIHDAPNVIVAVVDTGVNLTHQDMAPNLWTNPSPSTVYKDLHGANFVGGRGAIVSGDPTDDDGHGTHVAGIIGAVGNNAIATAGIAWKVQLMAIKVFPPNAKGSISEIAAGVNYAITHGANIINASYGALGSTGYTQTELTVINGARNAGVIFVAAAGNDTSNLDTSRAYPASYPLDNVVTVGSSNRRDEVSTFSNYGAAVDLFAPGEDIMSLNYSSSTGSILLSGTSMAAPQITGAFALLKAQFPNDTYRQLINRMLRGAEAGSTTNFAGKAQTGGRLNLLRALTTTTNRPFNDDFADRPRFATDNLAIRSNNADANSTAESGEPDIAGSPATKTLWWEWTAKAGGVVTVNTSGSAYDTVLAVYTGSALNALTLVGANDNDGSTTTSRITFTADAGTTYQIAVGGKNGASGLTLLNVGTIPANDAFSSPVTLSGDSTHVIATNANCSRESGEPRILGFTGGTSLWYKWTAPRTARYQLSAYSSDFDPIMAVYTGTALNALTTISASDNTGADNTQTAALCTVDATAGTTYLITVDSKTTSSVGQFSLSIVDSVWQATAADAITGAPSVAPDGTVYVGSVDKLLYAFAPDGTQKWTFPTGGLIDTCSPAIADDGTVYVGSADGKLYAVNPDGSSKWTHDFKSGSTPVGAGCSPAIAADGTIYIRITDGYVYALNPADGSVRWKSNVNATVSSFYGNPVIGPDGTIYQGSDETDSALYAINPNGTSKWKFAANSGIYGAPAIDAAGNIYIASLAGRVYRVSPAGTEVWRFESGGNISSSVALSADGTTLYYAGYDSQLYAVDTASGSLRWRYALGAEVRASSPAVDANGVIYIGSYDHRLYAVNSTGRLNRTYDMGNWLRSAPVIAGTRLYVGSNDQKLYAFDLAVGAASGPWPQYRHNARHLGRAVNDALAIAVQPRSQTAIIGLPLTLSVTATGQGTLAFQWSKDGTPIAGATGAAYTVGSVTAGNAGTYTVKVTDAKGSITSDAAVIDVTTANSGRLTNISVRTTAGSSDRTLIVGFVLSGSATKPLLVRGVGPALAKYGVTDALADPSITVRNTVGGVVASNDNWSSTLAATFVSVGAFALTPGSADAALVQTLPPGNYTMQVTGANNATGTALAEAYDLDPTNAQTIAALSRITNVSARAQVGTGGNILIAGFAISGNVPKRVLVRGIGPGLAAYGVAGVLANPRLDVYHDQTIVSGGSNDDWGGASSLTDAFNSVGAFALPSATSKDAALVLTLPPGSYTAQVSGVNSTTGVALVEIYEMP